MGEHDKKINSIKREINYKLDDSLKSEVLIPNWEAISLDEGYKWLASTIYEGYEIKFKVSIRNNINSINFLFWEYGEVEPDF